MVIAGIRELHYSDQTNAARLIYNDIFVASNHSDREIESFLTHHPFANVLTTHLLKNAPNDFAAEMDKVPIPKNPVIASPALTKINSTRSYNN